MLAYLKGALVSVTFVFEISIEIHQSGCIIQTDPSSNSYFPESQEDFPYRYPFSCRTVCTKRAWTFFPNPSSKVLLKSKKVTNFLATIHGYQWGKNIHCVFAEHLTLLYVESCSQYSKIKTHLHILATYIYNQMHIACIVHLAQIYGSLNVSKDYHQFGGGSTDSS